MKISVHLVKIWLVPGPMTPHPLLTVMMNWNQFTHMAGQRINAKAELTKY